MLQKYPEMRPTAEKCLKHSCFKDHDQKDVLLTSATKRMMLYKTNLDIFPNNTVNLKDIETLKDII